MTQATFDFSDVLAASTARYGLMHPHEDCELAAYISSFNWLTGWRSEQDTAAQSEAIKKWFARRKHVKRSMTIRNRNTNRNVHLAFNELMDAVENRRVDGVIVADIAVFAPSFSEARFYVCEVLVPMGVRFVDCKRRFDSFKGDVDTYIKGVYYEFLAEECVINEYTRLMNTRITRDMMPYAYLLSSEGEISVDRQVADVVPVIFEMLAEPRWWTGKIERQVNALGYISPSRWNKKTYGYNRPQSDLWTIQNIRKMATNPFYTGAFDPVYLASKQIVGAGLNPSDFPYIPDHHEALVTRELFDAANEGLERNRYTCPTEAEGRKPMPRGKKN